MARFDGSEQDGCTLLMVTVMLDTTAADFVCAHA
jgi:hypothetical protein